MKKLIIKIALILLASFLCCKFFDYAGNEVINPDIIFSRSIDIFGIALAVTAIFFTVIDRYKDKQASKFSIELKCFPILKEMCVNVLGMFMIIVIMFGISIFESSLNSIPLP